MTQVLALLGGVAWAGPEACEVALADLVNDDTVDYQLAKQTCPLRAAQLSGNEVAFHKVGVRDLPSEPTACVAHTAAATAAIVPASAVLELDGAAYLTTHRGLGLALQDSSLPGACTVDAHPCPIDQQGEPDVQALLRTWYPQPVWAGCTGVLLDQGLLLTAGHCADVGLDAYVVFADLAKVEPATGCQQVGPQLFGCDTAGATPLTAARITTASGVLGADIAFWQVAPLPGVTLPEPIGLDRLAPQLPAQVAGTPVYSIGYPLGLPAKLARDGELRGAHDGLVDVSLDAFVGSSGTPVYGCDDNKLLGLLVQGEPDFACVGGCAIFEDYRDDTWQRAEELVGVTTLRAALGGLP